MEANHPGPPEGRTSAGARGWWRPGFRGGEAEPREVLEAIFALRPERVWRRVQGRETFPWPGRREWVVKRFEGGPARDWWYERLREGEVPRSPGRREAENLLELERDGLPAPRVVAWVEEDAARRHPALAGRSGRSALVMDRVELAGSLREALARAGAAERERLGTELLELVARLHGLGWYHRDLYLEHVARAADGGLVLLDLGRARREGAPRERWFVKDLAALYVSAPGAVPPRARLRFLAGWLARRRATTESLHEPRELRRWSRVVEAKARRLSSHAPREADAAGAAHARVDGGDPGPGRDPDAGGRGA